MNVYINDLAVFLPNDPINNEEIENVLGKINNIRSRVKRIVLKNNKIETRHYAIDPDSGRLTHSNARLAAEAVRRLEPHVNFSVNDIECLSCGTTCGDLLFPGHALMVLGELGIPECEAVTTHGICISGMTAFKYAFMNVASGQSKNAVAAASETASSFMRTQFFNTHDDLDTDLEKKPILAFDADFLRWMLSDGAGAAYLSNKPNETGISLRVDWIENISYAGQLETCQYSGGVKNPDGSMTGWRDTESIDPKHKTHIMAVKQDIKLLDKWIVKTAIDQALARVIDKHHLTPEDIDWYLPHYSSGFFRDKFYDRMKAIGFEIPYRKWFTNLYTKGNTGSAAIYIIMEEIFKSGRLKKDQKLLCFIPESGRFSHCYMMLSVV